MRKEAGVVNLIVREHTVVALDAGIPIINAGHAFTGDSRRTVPLAVVMRFFLIGCKVSFIDAVIRA